MGTAPYLASDVTQLPYRLLLAGGVWKWPWPLRIWFIVRKAFGWHFAAVSGRRPATRIADLDIRTLPRSIQSEFFRFTAEIERFGFFRVALVRSDNIGYLATYSLAYRSSDLRTGFTVTVTKTRVGSAEAPPQWTRSFHTELSQDRAILTGDRSSGLECFLPKGFQLEVLPTDTTTDALWHRHHERLVNVPVDEIVKVPHAELIRWHLGQAQKGYEHLRATGFFRPLTPDEEAELKQVKYGFE